MKKETHIFSSFVQLPISGGIEPEKLFELIPLKIKRYMYKETSRRKKHYHMKGRKEAKLTVILDL